MRYLCHVFAIGIVCSVVLSLALSSTATAQRKSTLGNRLNELEQVVKKMSGEQRSLEARIAVLEQLHLTPSPQVVRQAYVTSNKDAIIGQIVNLAANAYQYRIRPGTMGGGGGSYEGYKIPRMMNNSDYADFTAVIHPNVVIFLGISKNNLGTVQVTLCDDGKTEGWLYTGDFE